MGRGRGWGSLLRVAGPQLRVPEMAGAPRQEKGLVLWFLIRSGYPGTGIKSV